MEEPGKFFYLIYVFMIMVTDYYDYGFLMFLNKKPVSSSESCTVRIRFSSRGSISFWQHGYNSYNIKSEDEW